MAYSYCFNRYSKAREKSFGALALAVRNVSRNFCLVVEGLNMNYSAFSN